MMKGYVLANKLAGNGEYAEDLSALEVLYDEPLQFVDVTQITDHRAFFQKLDPDDFVILAGGDGTLNHFVNDTAGLTLPENLLYFPIGIHNDFARKFGRSYGDNPFPVENSLTRLPAVEVNGNRCRFLNGVACGLDRSGASENGKPVTVKITVDGETHTYQKAWLAVTVQGKCGGGMYPAPEQDGNGEPPVLSVMVLHGCGRLRARAVLASLLRGGPVKHKKTVEVLSGREISVAFERPMPLRIDGETVETVTGYRASAAAGENS